MGTDYLPSVEFRRLLVRDPKTLRSELEQRLPSRIIEAEYDSNSVRWSYSNGKMIPEEVAYFDLMKGYASLNPQSPVFIFGKNVLKGIIPEDGRREIIRPLSRNPNKWEIERRLNSLGFLAEYKKDSITIYNSRGEPVGYVDNTQRIARLRDGKDLWRVKHALDGLI